MSRLIEQIVTFKASPHAVYEALMDSDKHAAFTNNDAHISREVGGEYTSYTGYITGKNLELVPDQKIIQTWRAVDWLEGHYSQVTFVLTPLASGTQLHFTHADLPDGTEAEFTQGWIDNYWEPLKVYLEK